MSTDQNLWKPHSVDETLEIYRDWADNYDADVGEWGYATPARLAVALRTAGANMDVPVLDFGCGTGLSGIALKSVGFDVVDGTDVSAEMLAKAKERGLYRQVWKGTPGSLGHIKRGDYRIIVACGVVSLGAAPPETLDLLIDALAPGGLVAFSYNQATLDDARYMAKLDEVLTSGQVEMAFEEYGPHLPAKNMNSTVYILQKT